MLFKFMLELLHEAQNWPDRCLAKRAECLAIDVFGDLKQKRDVGIFAVAIFDTMQNVFHPAAPFPAGRALPATFVGVEVRDPFDHLDSTPGVINDNDSRRAKHRTRFHHRLDI